MTNPEKKEHTLLFYVFYKPIDSSVFGLFSNMWWCWCF